MKRITKVEEIELSPDLSVLYVSSFARMVRLCGEKDCLLETNDSFFLLKGAVAFRCLKEKARPKILKTSEIWLSPDVVSVKAVVSEEELLSFAVKNGLCVFETGDSYLIPSDVTLMAKKKLRNEGIISDE